MMYACVCARACVCAELVPPTEVVLSRRRQRLVRCDGLQWPHAAERPADILPGARGVIFSPYCNVGTVFSPALCPAISLAGGTALGHRVGLEWTGPGDSHGRCSCPVRRLEHPVWVPHLAHADTGWWVLASRVQTQTLITTWRVGHRRSSFVVVGMTLHALWITLHFKLWRSFMQRPSMLSCAAAPKAGSRSCCCHCSSLAEYTCCSSVAFERPNANTFTFTSLQVRSAIVGAVFRKAISLHPVSAQFFSSGQLTNLFSGAPLPAHPPPCCAETG
jgi:hypothetical protein